MKIISSILLAIAGMITVLSCSPSANSAGSKLSDTVLSAHKTVAILPFEVVFPNNLQKAKKFSDEEMKLLNQYFSLALQKHLAEEINNKKKRFPYSVNIQPVETTNQLLSSGKISFGALLRSNKQEFCQLLNTDAVIAPQAVFGIKESLQDITSGGKLEMRFSIFDSRFTAAAWVYNRSSNNIYTKFLTGSFLTPSLPQVVYSSDDKYEKIMLPWLQAIDELFGHFTADCPYKKKNNF